MTGLRFYPASHRYKLDGQWVPGVTTILNVLAKPALTKWAAREVAEYVARNRDAIEHLYAMGEAPMVAALKEVPWQKRDTAAARGTAFHEYAQRILLGESVEVDDAQAPLVESAIKFMTDWGIRPVLVEAAVARRAHPQYAGTLDLVADHNRGPRAIFDWKSGKRIYPATALQCAAYAFADFHTSADVEGERSMSEHGIEAAYGVHIRADDYDVHPLTFNRNVHREFLTVAETHAINGRAEGDWRRPGTGYVGAPIDNTEDAA